MHRASLLSAVFLIGITQPLAWADQAVIEGSSVAEPGDKIILLMPGDLADDAFLVVLHDGVPVPSSQYSFASRVLVVDQVQEGKYQVIVKPGDTILTKSILVGRQDEPSPEAFREPAAQPLEAGVAPAAFVAADDEAVNSTPEGDVASALDKLKNLDQSKYKENAINFYNRLRELVEEFKGTPGGDDRIKTQLTMFVSANFSDLLTDFALLYGKFATPEDYLAAVADKLKTDGIQVSSPAAPATDTSSSSSVSDEPVVDPDLEKPASFKETFAEAIRKRFFDQRIPDFDPTFINSVQEVINAVEAELQRVTINTDADEFRANVRTAVERAIDDTVESEGTALTKWQQFFNEFRVVLYVLEEADRTSPDKRKGFYERLLNTSYKAVVQSNQVLERDDIQDQRQAFEIFVNGLKKAIGQQTAEEAAARERRGSGGAAGQAAGTATTATGGGGGTILGRMHERKMGRMYYHHKRKMARIRGY